MSQLPTRVSSSQLAPQRLGILPTRRFWDGRAVALVRASTAGAATGAAVFAVAAFASAGLSIWLKAGIAGLASSVAILLAWGIIERVARSVASR
jgi:hypothetical protein